MVVFVYVCLGDISCDVDHNFYCFLSTDALEPCVCHFVIQRFIVHFLPFYFTLSCRHMTSE